MYILGDIYSIDMVEISQQWISGPPPLSLKNVQNYCILYKSEAEDWEFLIASLFCWRYLETFSNTSYVRVGGG